MIVIESECVDCDLPCIYDACPYYRVLRYYCDECHEEVDELYVCGNDELCKDCALKQLEKVEYHEE